MEVDQIQCKFPSSSTGYGKFASKNLGQSQKMDDQHPDDEAEGENKFRTANDGRGGVDLGGGGIDRFYRWPSSRIVRVSRASGGKDRHSKVLTSKGLRDRRVRLSVNTAIQFYDLQDRLGYDQPSKAVEWLLTAAASSIAELPPINTPFPDTPKQLSNEKRSTSARGYQLAFDSAEVDINGGGGGGNPSHLQREPVTKSSGGSSNSETSKGSGISIARSEGRIKARERAKERAAEKEKEKENESSYVASFTELLNGRINCINGGHDSNAINPDASVQQHYFTSGLLGPPATQPTLLFSMAADHHQAELPPFSFAADNLVSAVNSAGLATINRGTLQSNSPSPPSLLPRFPTTDGSPPNFFIRTAAPIDNQHHFLSGFDDARLQLYYGGAHGNNGRHSGEKGKEKN